jgi:hypothetical protein
VNDQRAAVHRIHELGGSVAYDYQFDTSGRGLKNPEPAGWPWLRRLVGDEYFQEVVRVDLDKKPVTDSDLRLIGILSRLTVLSLNFTSVSDDGVRHLDGLRRLRYLGLAKTRVTSDGLRYLEHMNDLDTLILQHTAGVNDAGLPHLKGLARLELLNLGGTAIQSGGLSELAGCTNLGVLVLSDTNFGDEGLEALTRMPRLAELHLTGSKVSGKGLLRIREEMPDCIIECDMIRIDDRLFSSTKAKQRWNSMAARMRALNGEGRLKLIDLSYTRLADEHLSALYPLHNAEAIDLRNTQVTEAGVQELRRALPDCTCLN